MSDYLGRLAARTVAPDGILRPRVASAFEPPREQETFVIAPRAEAAPAPVRTVAAAPPQSERGNPVAALRTAPAILERPHVDHAGEPRRETERVEPQRDPEERVQVQVQGQDRAHEQIHEQVHERVHERVRDRVQVRNRIHNRASIRDHDRERIIEEHTHGVSEAPPPIEITIGRIDVRAVVGAPPQKPQPKRPPIQSLEEYVARRDGGGR